MKATKQFIEDAVKGGWNRETIGISIGGGFCEVVQMALLDPKVWQAVGKTRGWENEYPDRVYEAYDTFFYEIYNGRTIEEALSNLI